MNMKLPSIQGFNVKDLVKEAGNQISTQVSRVVQVRILKFHYISTFY
jgi:hypothetical protein